MNGISTLIKNIPENSLTCSALWGHSKKMIVIYEPESRPSSPDKESVLALISDFSASRTEINIFVVVVVYKPAMLWYFVMAAYQHIDFRFLNCRTERINFCCAKPLSLYQFATAALRN